MTYENTLKPVHHDNPITDGSGKKIDVLYYDQNIFHLGMIISFPGRKGKGKSLYMVSGISIF